LLFPGPSLPFLNSLPTTSSSATLSTNSHSSTPLTSPCARAGRTPPPPLSGALTKFQLSKTNSTPLSTDHHNLSASRSLDTSLLLRLQAIFSTPLVSVLRKLDSPKHAVPRLLSSLRLDRPTTAIGPSSDRPCPQATQTPLAPTHRMPRPSRADNMHIAPAPQR
jgi:hypothetical protein